ncbi:MAG: penicillin-binding protein [Treponema sp. GWA1_62_8]|nr:MAG: penicillin-binding protein [Treponema sp. GWA1_62_8]OHE67886.1 MAG: penicillin-binding protein [Treponema sp. GWC1_61_84]
MFSILLAVLALAVISQYAIAMLVRGGRPAFASRGLSERGPILDRNGRILAMQTRLGNVTIWKPEVSDPAALAAELAPILEIDGAEFEQRLRNTPGDFLYAKKRVDQSALAAIEAARSGGRLRGVGMEPVVARVYPEKRLASQLVGFVGDDDVGLAGIEYAFQSDLAGSGPSSYGDQIFLTIDANVQYIMEGVARRTLEANSAEAVMMIALEAKTGDVLGYVSLPDFDPNDIRSSTDADRMDRPAVWAYEPGSVFKIFSIASILELGGIEADTTFYCDGKYEKTLPSGEKITIKCLGSHGLVDAEDIIKYSCNAGAAYASDRVDAESFSDMIRSFGFSAKTGLSVPGETAGFLRSTERWSARSKQTIAIGQEIAVSALQMVQAATAIANDGLLVKPRVVSKVIASDGSVKRDFPVAASRRVISAETARAMRNYMLSAASEAGTGRRANLEDVPIAVKTGTAQLIDPSTGTYSSTDFVASCIALVPAADPDIIVYHVIVRPRGASYLGGRIAAPPVAEAADALVDYLGLGRGRNPQATHSGTIVLGKNTAVAIGQTMPDLRGFSKRSLLPLLLRDDIRVEILGDGWVKRQVPEPGVPVSAGDTVTLELE